MESPTEELTRVSRESNCVVKSQNQSECHCLPAGIILPSDFCEISILSRKHIHVEQSATAFALVYLQL